jgi:fatty acid desaturase
MIFTGSGPIANKPGCAANAVWHTLAIAYTFTGYSIGLFLLYQSSVWLNALGVLLLTHALLYSAYLSHEFMHGSVFTRRWILGIRQLNAIGGNLMLWLNGGCYARFNDLALLHIKHHVDQVDYAIDFAQFTQSASACLSPGDGTGVVVLSCC